MYPDYLGPDESFAPTPVQFGDLLPAQLKFRPKKGTPENLKNYRISRVLIGF